MCGDHILAASDPRRSAVHAKQKGGSIGDARSASGSLKISLATGAENFHARCNGFVEAFCEGFDPTTFPEPITQSFIRAARSSLEIVRHGLCYVKNINDFNGASPTPWYYGALVGYNLLIALRKPP